jgi:hypothetical protein
VVNEKSLDEQVDGLITEYLHTDPKWIKKGWYHLDKIGSDIIATFAIMVPYEVKLKKGYRLSRMSITQSKSLISEKTLLFGQGS